MKQYNIDYIIQYKQISYGLFKRHKKFVYAIIELKWFYSYYENTNSDTRLYYSSSYNHLKKFYKNIISYETLEEAQEALKSFKLNSIVYDKTNVLELKQ